MSFDLRQMKFSSAANSFKNTGVYTTSLTMSGTIGAGATKTVTTTVTLEEDQVFAYALARYNEVAKNSGNAWQKIPTFDASVPSTPIGFLKSAIYFTINGNNITFTAFMFNPYGSTETLTSTTFNIRYVAYTLAQ